MSGNVAMLIFLGKNVLGQTDRADVTSGERPVSPARFFAFGDNGRAPIPPEMRLDAPRTARTPPGGFRWPDGSWRVLPPTEGA